MGEITNRVTSGFLLPLSVAGRALPAAVYGVRVAVSASIALYVAFFLQLDQPGWAGTTAVVVAQPVLGAALRKGVFRLIGTVAGAAAGVALVAFFPQSRTGFFLGLAVWGGLCGYAATALRNFAAYAAMLAGFTAAIVALNAIEAPQQVLPIAISRGSAITIGITATTLVFSLTDFGSAREDLARRMIQISQDIMSALIAALSNRAASIESSRAVRRALLAEVAALDQIVDEAIGESSAVRARAAALQAALSGLFSALSSWRTIESHFSGQPGLAASSDAKTVLAALPSDVLPGALVVKAATAPALLRDKFQLAGRELLSRPADDMSTRLLLDQTGKALLGLAQTMNGIALLRTPSGAQAVAPRPVRNTFDPLVAFLNGLRVVAAIAAAALFWIFSEWPNGPIFVTFVMIVLMLYIKQDAEGLDTGLSMALGCSIAAVGAGVLKFFLLPSHESYFAFSLLLAVYLIPGGALSTLPKFGRISFIYDKYFIPILIPANQMSYDLSAFFNNALAIVAACVAGSALCSLIPPLSPALQARRQVAAALRDLGRLASGRWSPSAEMWEIRLYDRMIALPKSATPLQRGQLVTALGAGLAIHQLRELADAAGEREGADRLLSLLAEGDPEQARAAAAELAGSLKSWTRAGGQVSVQRFCAGVHEIEDALASHPEFFAGRD